MNDLDIEITKLEKEIIELKKKQSELKVLRFKKQISKLTDTEKQAIKDFCEGKTETIIIKEI